MGADRIARSGKRFQRPRRDARFAVENVTSDAHAIVAARMKCGASP
jgi:hypothetical protein